MKQFPVLVAMALASSVFLSGWGKTEETPPPAPAPASSDVTPAPTTPPPAAEAPKAPASTMDLVASAKDGVEQAMTLAKAGKYQEALALLQQKTAEVQSNPD